MTQPLLSPQAHERLRSELDERSTTRRREISAWIERAREHGDISENADYDAAKNEQGHNEARIRQLEQILKDATIVEHVSGDTVEPGVIVEIRIAGDDVTETYLYGSIEERHADLEVLTPTSPLGAAVAGHAAGDEVEYEGPRRTIRVSVVSIRPLG